MDYPSVTMDYLPEYFDRPSWLTEPYIQTLLRHARNDFKLRVTHIDVENAFDVTYVSVIKHVTVEYRRRENHKQVQKTCSLILKFMPHDDLHLKLDYISDVDYFLRERHMYEVTLPSFYQLAGDKVGAGTRLLKITAGFYFTTRKDVIVMDDLREEGFKKADRLQGLNLQHSLLAITALARLHASSMVLLAKDPKSMDHYKMFENEDHKGVVTDDVKMTLRTLATVVASWKGFERFEERLRSYVDSFDRVRETAKHEASTLKVLNHGEFCTNSLLFSYENGVAVDVKVVKWKYVNVASPAYDILHFLYSSLGQDVLENYRDRLVEVYFECLKETLAFLGDGREVNLEDVTRELENKAHCAVYTSCFSCVDLALPRSPPDIVTSVNMMETIFSRRVFRKMFERRLSAMEKHGIL